MLAPGPGRQTVPYNASPIESTSDLYYWEVISNVRIISAMNQARQYLSTRAA